VVSRPPRMPCGDCERKLGKVAAPDPWKSGSRNNNETGRAFGENKALSKGFSMRKHNPYAGSSCLVCKQSVPQSGKYCQTCAYAKGVCAMCGKQILDTRMYAMGDSTAGKGRKVHDPRDYHPAGWQPEAPAAEEGGASTSRRKKARKTAAAPSAEPSGQLKGSVPARLLEAGWQLDPGSGYYYSLAAQAYYDSHSGMYFVGGVWTSSLPLEGTPAQGAPTVAGKRAETT